MKLTWTDWQGKEISGRIDAALWPFVEILGVDGAARFFLTFGGYYIHIPTGAFRDDNRIVHLFGREKADALAQMIREMGFEARSYRVPLVNDFLARYLRSRGKSLAQVCNLLRHTDVSVRNWLKADDVRAERNRKALQNMKGAAINEAVDDGLVSIIENHGYAEDRDGICL